VKECRVIRRHPDIVSWGDGMDFRRRDGKRLYVKRIDAEIYHYGWVRPPTVMSEKNIGFQRLYHSDEIVSSIALRSDDIYNDLGHLRQFEDTHPVVMRERIAASKWDFDPRIDQQRPDWLRHAILFLEPLTKRIRRLNISNALGFEGPSVKGIDIAIFALLMMFLLCSAFSIALTQIGYFSALILWIGKMAAEKRSDVPRTPLDRFLLLYVAAETLATIFAYYKGQSLLYMQRRLLLLPIMYILAANVRSLRQLRILVGAMLASALFVALWSLRDVVLHFGEYLLLQRRLEAFQIYMTAGGIMMIAMLVLLPFVLHRKTPRSVRIAGALVMLPLGFNLLFTFTRSSWLGFLAGALVIGTKRFRRIFLPAAFVVLVLVMISSPAMKERMTSIFDPYHPNNISRLHMWETGWGMFKDHPIVGIGDIGTEHLWDKYAQPDWKPEGHLHNNLVMWLATLGIVGFTALCALFIEIWRMMARIERDVHGDWFLGSFVLGGLAVMAGFHVNGLFEWNFGDAEIIMLIWATVGLTMAARKLSPTQGTM
jgi:O-antigen ligase